MNTSTRNPRLNRLVLRIHGTILIVLTLTLTTAGGVGYATGEGSFGVLQREPIGYIGLFQAYLLMTTVGIALWLGSRSDRPRAWHLIGFLAHVPPLAANLIFWSDVDRYGITHVGVAVHLVLMALELGGWIGTRARPALPPPLAVGA